MVIRRQEQHSIMNFAVPFLKMLTLYMLWRARVLVEIFYRLLSSSDLDLVTIKSKNLGTEGVPKIQNMYFTFGYNSGRVVKTLVSS